jgi:DNA-binding transcriptional LysR family regulator
MDKHSEIAVFLAVVDQGSFSAAARALGQTPSAVGKRVRFLEERLGVNLLIRSTRRMALTEAGLRYSEEARDLQARLEALEDDLKEGGGALRGSVRMTAPTAFGQRYVTPALVGFMEMHPDVNIALSLTDKLVDLTGEGLDLAVRTSVQQDSELIGRRVGPYRRRICAAPQQIAMHGAPDTPAELTRKRCLRLPNEIICADWGLKEGVRTGGRLGNGFVCNSLDALRTASLAGLGIACLPDFLIRDDLQAGRLVEVLPSYRDPSIEGDIVILRPATSVTTRRVRALSDHLFHHLGTSCR